MADLALSQEEIDSLAEVFNISFGAAANKLNTLLKSAVKLAKPKISVAGVARIGEFTAKKNVVGRCRYGNSYSGEWFFVFEYGPAVKLVDFFPPGDPSEAEELKVLGAFKGLLSEIVQAACPMISGTINKEITCAEPSVSLSQADSDVMEFENVYPEGALEVDFTFKIGADIDSTLVTFIGLPMGKGMASDFLQGIPGQMAELDAAAAAPKAKEKVRTRFDDVIEYCRSIGDFSLVKNLQASVVVRFGKRTMKLGDLWNMDAGAVIPLKMRKDDHVDVLFGGKVIGRGDVVSVKEKYGAKLTEVRL